MVKVKKKTLKFISLWLPVVLWAGMIFKFSSGTVPVTSQVYWQNFLVKKIGHLLLFGTLALLFYRAFHGQGINRKNAAVWAVVASFLYGVSDEFHQMYTQGREARVRDVLIDGVGASLVTYLVYKFLPKFPKKVQSFLLQFDIK
jgi:VanZ family protein